MQEKDVASLATLLQKSPEEVSAAIEKGSISDFISEFSSGHEIFTKSELSGLKSNLKAEYENEILNGEIPKPIYDRAKGFALEATERKLAKAYGVDEFSGMDDLVNKIVESKAKSPEDVTELKTRMNELIAAHESEKKELMSANDKRFVNLRVDELVKQIPIDAEGTRLENQRKMLKALIRTEFDFGVNDDNIVINNAPVTFKQKNLDPRPINEVVMDFAKDYVNLRSEGGGRGDTSSTGSSSVKQVSMSEYMQKNGIQKNSVEQYQAIQQFLKDGVEIID